jgi:hypothetical protein
MKDYYKIARDIIENHKLYYLKLNITLPKESLEEVTAVYNQKFFVKHRGAIHKGWLSAALHSIDGDFWKTMSGKKYGYKSDSDESIKWNWTDVCDYAPKTTEFFKKEFPANGYRRLRYMLLEPSGYIKEHCDTTSGIVHNPRKVDSIFSALNMCITQPDNCELTHLDNGPVPFKPFEIYLFNNDEIHHAFNKSNENRFHIIAHANYNDDFCKLFVESFEKNYEPIHK